MTILPVFVVFAPVVYLHVYLKGCHTLNRNKTAYHTPVLKMILMQRLIQFDLFLISSTVSEYVLNLWHFLNKHALLLCLFKLPHALYQWTRAKTHSQTHSGIHLLSLESLLQLQSSALSSGSLQLLYFHLLLFGIQKEGSRLV